MKSDAFVFGVIYRPPSGSLDEFFRFVEPMLEFISTFKMPVVVMSDFTINILQKSKVVNEFIDIIYSNGFSNIIDIPTHITDSSETLIDICLTSCYKNDTETGVLTRDISDHLSLFCFIPKSLSHTARQMNTNTSARIITEKKK